MSSETSAWAKEQRCGDPVTKAVLMEIANWAKPTGVCEYLSVKRIAEVVEVSVRTVQRHIARLEDPDPMNGGLGMIRRVERHREDGGRWANMFELVGYQPPFPAGNTPPVKLTPPPAKLSRGGDAGDTLPPDTGVTPPVTIVSPDKKGNIIPPSPSSEGDTPAADFDDDPGSGETDDAAGGTKPAAAAKAERLPQGWRPPAVANLANVARQLVEQWPPGAYEAVCETFRLHWTAATGRAGRKGDWTAELGKWLIKDHPKIIRDAKAGVSFAAIAPSRPAAGRGTRPVAAKASEDDRSAQMHAAVRIAIGAALYDAWFEPVAFCFGEIDLVAVFPSEFSRSWAEDRFGDQLRELAAELYPRSGGNMRMVAETAPARRAEAA